MTLSARIFVSIKTRTLVKVCLGMMFVLYPSGGGAETLKDAVASTLQNHPSVISAIANKDAVAEDKAEAKSDYFPQLNIKAAGGRAFSNNSTSRGSLITRDSAYSYVWEGGATLTQMLFDGFATGARVGAAEARRESAKFEIYDVQENLALRSAVSYLDVIRSRETLSRIKAQLALVDDYIVRLSAMVEQGGADDAVLKQARDIKTQLQATMINIEAQKRRADSDYEELTGHSPPESLFTPIPRIDLIPNDPQQAIDYARESHPLLKASLNTVDALALDADAEKAGYLPDFTGELSYFERDQAEEIGGELEDARALVRMNWDYSFGGAQQARVKRALKRKSENQAIYDERLRAITRDIKTAYSDRIESRQQLLLNKKRVSLNKDILSTNKAQFDAARITLLQLLQAEMAYFNASQALYNSQFRLLASQYAILAGMGRLRGSLEIKQAQASLD